MHVNEWDRAQLNCIAFCLWGKHRQKTKNCLLVKSTAKQQLLRSSARVQYSPSTAKERKKIYTCKCHAKHSWHLLIAMYKFEWLVHVNRTKKPLLKEIDKICRNQEKSLSKESMSLSLPINWYNPYQLTQFPIDSDLLIDKSLLSLLTKHNRNNNYFNVNATQQLSTAIPALPYRVIHNLHKSPYVSLSYLTGWMLSYKHRI